MIADAAAAFAEIFTPPFRAALIKVLALTLLVLVLAAAVLHHVLIAFVTVHSLWLATTISIVTGLGLAVGSVFLVAPVSALVAGFFIDDLAARVEHDIDPAAPPGRPLAVWTALVLSVRFALLSLGGHAHGAGAFAGAGRERGGVPVRQCLPAQPPIFRIRRAAALALGGRCRTPAPARRAIAGGGLHPGRLRVGAGPQSADAACSARPSWCGSSSASP